MLIAFYVTLCEKTFQGSGLGASCQPVSSDGTVTVMYKDPDVEVGHKPFAACMRIRVCFCMDVCIRACVRVC